MFLLTSPVFDRATPENLQRIRQEIDTALSVSQPPQIYVHPLAIEFVQQAYGSDAVPPQVSLDAELSTWGILAAYPLEEAAPETPAKPKKGKQAETPTEDPADA